MQCRNTASDMAYKLLLPLLLAALALPAQARLYKWVDAEGKVHYTDTLPPDSARQGNAELSRSGNVVRKTESAEDKQKRLAAEAAEAERRKAAVDQARKDRALLATYTTEQEIDLARDRTLENHKLMIKSAQARLSQLEPSAQALEQKVQAAAKQGKPAPDYLRQQYESKRGEVAEAQHVIAANEEAMTRVRARYEAEKQRFRELTAKP